MAGTEGLHLLPLDGSVVKMKGLPFKASNEDVTRFFAGLAFSMRGDRICLRRHPDGRPNGEAFVIFESPEEARKATSKDRETFGDKFGERYVRVYPTQDADVPDMQAAVVQQSQAQGIGHHGHCDSVVKIKSLPFDATQLDLIQFFEAFKLKPNGVQLVVRSDNRPTGEAFVDFDNVEEAGRAIREKDHKTFSEKFGERYVRLIQVSRKEMQATLALRFGGEGILKMKGIPFKATPQDVRKFFAGFRIKTEGISFIMHADGRPTGMAFIEYDTPQEAVRAMDKDRAKFGPEYGDRFCMLQLVGRHEMDKVALQKESDGSAQKLLAAALATQVALQNPALMLGGSAPWLHHMGAAFGAGGGGGGGGGGGLGHLAAGGGGASSGMLDASALAAASQYSAQMVASQGMSSLLQQQQHAAAAVQQQRQQHAQQQQQQQQAVSRGLDASASWASSTLGSMDGGAAGPSSNCDSMFYPMHPQHQSTALPPDFYLRASADGRSAIPGAALPSGLWGAESQEQYDARMKQRSVSYSGTGGARGGIHHGYSPVPPPGGYHTGPPPSQGGLADLSSLKHALSGGGSSGGGGPGNLGW